ncbi:hypothetical protein P3T16_002635 [Paraburkholderia sp. GAS42]
MSPTVRRVVGVVAASVFKKLFLRCCNRNLPCRAILGLVGVIGLSVLLWAPPAAADLEISGKVGPEKYVEPRNWNLYDGKEHTMNRQGWLNKVPVKSPNDDPDCGDELHAHCHEMCVEVDLSKYHVERPLSVQYGGRFADDPNECRRGPYSSCAYGQTCADGFSNFKYQAESENNKELKVCAIFKHWVTESGRCGAMLINGVTPR